MKNLFVMLFVGVILGFASFALAQNDAFSTPLDNNNAFGLNLSEVVGVDIKFRTGVFSKYKWHGQDFFDDQGAYMTGITTKLPVLPKIGTGLYLDADSYFPIGSGSEEATQINYTLYYAKIIFRNLKTEAIVIASHKYYDLIKASSDEDGQETGIKIILPKILKIGGNPLVPKIYVAKLWNSSMENGSLVYDGNIYKAGLDYFYDIDNCILDFSAEITFIEGSQTIDNGFGYATFGVSTDVELDEGISATPFVNYQMTSENDINSNTGDIWAGIIINYEF